ncbi:hypothetical protein MHYP_G00084310 [Metynnis hypsauchen]
MPNDSKGLSHSCLDVIAEKVLPRADLKDRPFDNRDITMFVDGSSSKRPDGKIATGLAAVVHDRLLIGRKLQNPLSAQAAELIALTEACKLAKAPGSPSVTVSSPGALEASQHSDKNGHTNPSLSSHTLPPAGHNVSTEAQLRENGIIMETQAFEEVIEVPMVTKLPRQEGDGEEVDDRRKTPLLAFRENGSRHNLTALDDSQSQVQAGDV